jgi:hypothetical protein
MPISPTSSPMEGKMPKYDGKLTNDQITELVKYSGA